jgi:hypothetical protein
VELKDGVQMLLENKLHRVFYPDSGICSSSTHPYGQLSEVIVASTNNRTTGKFLNSELLTEDLSLVVYVGECIDHRMR